MSFKITFRYIIAVAFTAMLCVESFYSIFLVADYYANTESFAANCVNKNNPQMHCNGKCQLQKKINEADKKDKQSTERRTETQFNIISSKSFFASLTTLFGLLLDRKYFIHNTKKTIDSIDKFFHPPKTFFI